MSELPDRYDDAELEARAQDRSERRLFWRQLGLIVVIAVVVVLRLWLVQRRPTARSSPSARAAWRLATLTASREKPATFSEPQPVARS